MAGVDSTKSVQVTKEVNFPQTDAPKVDHTKPKESPSVVGSDTPLGVGDGFEPKDENPPVGHGFVSAGAKGAAMTAAEQGRAVKSVGEEATIKTARLIAQNARKSPEAASKDYLRAEKKYEEARQNLVNAQNAADVAANKLTKMKAERDKLKLAAKAALNSENKTNSNPKIQGKAVAEYAAKESEVTALKQEVIQANKRALEAQTEYKEAKTAYNKAKNDLKAAFDAEKI